MTFGRITTYLLALVVGGFLAFVGTEGLITARHHTIGFDIFGSVVVLVGHILLAYIPSSVASHKGRSGGKWFVYGFFLFPIAFVHSILITNYNEEYKECPFCAERVKKKAKVCRYCGKEL